MLAFTWIASLCFISLVSAGAVQDGTNAQRLARGLPPLRPKRLFEASTVESARRTKRSAPVPAPLGIDYSCNGQDGYAALCCLDFDVGDSPPFSSCQAPTDGTDDSFTCTDEQYTACCTDSACFSPLTVSSYTCPNAPYTIAACCDPMNTNTCSTVTTSTPGGPFEWWVAFLGVLLRCLIIPLAQETHFSIATRTAARMALMQSVMMARLSRRFDVGGIVRYQWGPPLG
ncbi:hypothetical protein CALVIDRAFT_96335 [Calocera viscosa TUFC12733]|uniref:Hydrophobin n=1 Tax=Calocera viscosa (strain TUFC12733) TaxID=1330018 RepID=A0A167MYE2_CALVF|nr:hypothetical protein CALVIDRAFT_96335 [Calocera viscosa TUFC12733]